METSKPPLKYLFTAMFKDGRVYEQGSDDVSLLAPEEERATRSGYTDVLIMEKESPLVSFVLKGDGHEYGVELRDGHFEIDGVEFRMHEEENLSNFHLVFFRRHRHHILQSRTADREVGHEIAYRFGWQANDPIKKAYQQVMQID
jgi:hypothetical protein